MTEIDPHEFAFDVAEPELNMTEQLIGKEKQISDLEKWIEHLLAKQIATSTETKKVTKELEMKTRMTSDHSAAQQKSLEEARANSDAMKHELLLVRALAARVLSIPVWSGVALHAIPHATCHTPHIGTLCHVIAPCHVPCYRWHTKRQCLVQQEQTCAPYTRGVRRI